MTENRRFEMRDAGHDGVRRRRVVFGATALGIVVLVVAIGVLISTTFPHAEDAMAPVSAVSTPAKVATARAETTSATAPSEAATTAAAEVATPAAPVVSTKVATKKPAKPKRVAAPVLPLGMKYVLPGSRQLLVVTGPKLGATHGTLRIYNLSDGAWKQVLSAPSRLGTYGLIDGKKRKQGTRTTPTGIWWPGAWVWGWHAKAPSGTKMPYRQTTDNVWWSAEKGSTYNTWVVSSRHVTGEHLVEVRIQYEYALSTGYNSPPNQVVVGRGTAIFLHVFDPPTYNNGLSAGCIGVSRADMIRVFRTMDPDLKPCFAVGTEKAGTTTSIASY
jgi:L,D-peptidoglycan transpeptidase YkuD (ErfK/YbiS/YcfS/YnhG family)